MIKYALKRGEINKKNIRKITIRCTYTYTHSYRFAHTIKTIKYISQSVKIKGENYFVCNRKKIIHLHHFFLTKSSTCSVSDFQDRFSAK